MKKVGTYSTEEIKAIEKAFSKNFDTLKGPGWKKVEGARSTHRSLKDRTKTQLMGFVNYKITKMKKEQKLVKGKKIFLVK